MIRELISGVPSFCASPASRSKGSLGTMRPPTPRGAEEHSANTRWGLVAAVVKGAGVSNGGRMTSSHSMAPPARRSSVHTTRQELSLMANCSSPCATWTRWDSPRGGAEECKSTPSARRHRPRPPRGHVMAWEPLPHRYSPGGRARRAVGSSASAQFIVQPINSTAYSSVQSSAVELNGKKQVGTTCDPSVCNASRVRGSSAQVLVSVSKVIRGSNAPSPLGLNDLNSCCQVPVQYGLHNTLCRWHSNCHKLSWVTAACKALQLSATC
mmetsp:Transcript_44631/g.75114  ORF Transcript_44631/g.75114 Transcript_44631/m.75114 type:complete len:268 (+) Transcript_44631:2529-3332(+)